MLFLKSLTFLLWNVAWGALLIYLLKWFLFNPKPRRFLGVRNPLTPGLVVRKREWLFTKARDLLHDFLRQAGDLTGTCGYLHQWEEQIRQATRDRTAFVDGWPLLPQGLKEKLRDSIAGIVRDIVSRILRRTVPHFIERLQVEHRIDEFDERFSAGFIYGYFRRYVYLPLLKIVAAVNVLIGILNLIWFLIIA